MPCRPFDHCGGFFPVGFFRTFFFFRSTPRISARACAPVIPALQRCSPPPTTPTCTRRGREVAQMLRAALQLAALASCLPAPARAGYCDHPDWAPIFADEFDGDALNVSTWSMLGNTEPNDSSCRSAMCLFENVRGEGGALVLTALRQRRGWANFTTGAVNSKGKVSFQATRAKPFRLCVSGRLPGGGGTGAGLWPAFWMMPNDDSCWPDHGGECVVHRGRRGGRRRAPWQPPHGPRHTLTHTPHAHTRARRAGHYGDDQWRRREPRHLPRL